MEAHFEVRRELTALKGSGWKPYNRIRWLYEDRTAPGVRDSEALARWRTLKRSASLRATTQSGGRWRCLGPTNIAGRMLTLAFQPDAPETVFAGSASGGLWRSLNGGESWVPIDDGLPTLSIGAVAVLESSPRTIVVGTGEPVIGFDGIYGLGILRSVDWGATWEQTNVISDPFLGRMGYYEIEENPLTGVLLAAGSSGLLRSVDAGATWAVVIPDGAWTDVKWRPGSADSVLAVREYGGLFLSGDGGLTFRQVVSGLPEARSMGGLGKIAWSPRDPTIVYASLSAADSFTVLGIYRSRDAGLTWELRSRPTYFFGYQGFYNNTVAVDPVDPELVTVGGIALARSDNGAANWELVGQNVHVDHHAIGYRPDRPNELWVATDGGMFRSKDRGETWEARNTDLVTMQLYAACSAPFDSSVGYAGAQDNGIPRFSRGEWSENFGGDGMLCHCDPVNPLHAYGEYQLGYRIKTQDGFLTWSEITQGLAGADRWVAPLDMDPNDAKRLVTATRTGVYLSTNGGDQWNFIGDGTDVVAVAISPIAPSRIWAHERSSGKVRTTGDGGATWTAVQAAPFAGIGGTSIVADPHDSLGAYCTYLHHWAGSPLILKTIDGGATWVDITGDLGEQSVHTIAVDPVHRNHLVVGTDVGVWHTTDGGRLWLPYGEGLPNVLVLGLKYRRGSAELRAATFGRGLWSLSTGEGRDPTTSGTGARLELLTSNPSVGSLTFRISSGGGSTYDLSIYSISGQKVAAVTRGISDGSAQIAEWRPRTAASGVYIAVLETNGQRTSKKLVVLR